MTTTNRNKDIIRRFTTALNDRDFDAAMAITAKDLVNHAALPSAQGSDGMRTIFAKLVKAMPDLTMTCEDMIAEGDKVVCRVRFKGTQTGPFEMTALPLPATGRETSTEQIHIFRVVDDVVVEHWAGRDDILMLRQLGHFPAPKVAS